jgi:hypothetical protein
MILTIVQHTPLWVWGLLAGLIALGLVQTRDSAMTLSRILVIPAVMLALSLMGVVGAFGGRPMALGAWAVGLGLALLFGRRLVRSQGARWSAAERRVQMPGSWLPLALIVGLFAIKYLAGVSLAIEPRLAADAAFAGACCLAYGVFSGLFLARAWSLCALAGRSLGKAAAPLVALGLADGRGSSL